MIALFLLTIAPVTGAASLPCLPVASVVPKPTASAIEDHRTLRKALDEPMPQSPTMVMLYGKGGHLSTEEYSIIVVRSANGTWQGTAVGRRQIWVKDAPYRPMKRAEWVLDKASGLKLDDAISRPCVSDTKTAAKPADLGVPPRGFMAERIDVVTTGHATSTFYAEEGGGEVAALIRPQQ